MRKKEESRKDEAKPIDIFSFEDDLFESVNGDNDIQAIPTGNWLEVPLPVLCKKGSGREKLIKEQRDDKS